MFARNPKFILASSSKYKRQTLEKLQIPFECTSPEIDETPGPQENAEQLVTRLSISKARKAMEIDEVQTDNQATDNAIYIGVDQVAVFKDKMIGKSHTVENAVNQLMAFSGNTVTFLTGVALVNTKQVTFSHIEPYQVTFKRLTPRQIQNYVNAEMPLDCAGSFKCEGQGILLFDEMKGRDINSLVGMPLIALQELCLKFDIDLFECIGRS